MSSEKPLKVAVFNTSVETVEIIKQILEDEGFRVAGGTETFVTEFKRAKKDLRSYLARERPDVVVWDIALPYVENWKYFRAQVESGAFAGRGVVLTTTNRRVLDALVGPNDALEVIGKPFDLHELIDAVRQAADHH